MARILVADDEPAILEVIRLTCELDGHEVRATGQVEEAIESYASFRPDLMILDVNMPPEGGAHTILEQLDARGGTGRCAVIVVTGGLAEEEAKGLASQPRVCRVIQKPFELTHMRAAVRAALAACA